MKNTCPMCNQEYKLLRRCRYCNKWHCYTCSIHGICKECFIVLHQKQEIEGYFGEKYKENQLIA